MIFLRPISAVLFWLTFLLVMLAFATVLLAGRGCEFFGRCAGYHQVPNAKAPPVDRSAP